MNILFSVTVSYLLLALGIVNFVAALLLLSSCRCIPPLTGGRLMKKPAYMRFYKYHCYIWWVFWPSVIVHAVLAISRFVVTISGA